jgi:uncharacterized membrane protein
MSTSITALSDAPEFYQRDAIYMDAVLRPNRSLSVHGFRIVMLSLAAMSFFSGLAFLAIGAWPVIGFFGLDVILVYLAFKVNFRAGARECETVKVSAAQVAISKTCYRGKVGWWRVSPSFARVIVDELNEYETQVTLSAGGASLPLATCLSPPERVAFAAALKAALEQARDERYPTEVTV